MVPEDSINQCGHDPAVGPVRIQVADGAADMAEVYALRREVFIVEQAVPEEAEWDGLDGAELGTVHLLGTGADGTFGTVRMLTGRIAADKNGGRPDDVVLGRLAVRKPVRGAGLGAVLVRALEAQAGLLGGTGVYLEAQVQAIAFYERLGYKAFGPEFDDGSGIQHRVMRRSLPVSDRRP